MKHIYKKILYLVFLLSPVLFWSGCHIINPSEPTPTYIHVDSFLFKGNLQHITTSHQINTVWIYYNDNLIGTFDLPCTIPVITTGASGTLTFAPGVEVDGMNNNLSGYAFYTLDTLTLATQPGKTVTYEPKTGFYSDVKIQVISNFDFGLTNLVQCAGDVPIITDTSAADQYEGPGVGSITLSAVGDSSVDSTSNSFAIPYGETAFLELNYKSSVQFYVGIQSNIAGLTSTPFYVAAFNPNSQWQKVYIALQDFVATYTGATYTFYIKAMLPDGGSSGKLLLDNIQIVNF